jgi:uncharacterized protein (TIGR03435 family)
VLENNGAPAIEPNAVGTSHKENQRNGSFDDGCPRPYGLGMARGIRTVVIVGTLGCAAHALQAQSTGKVEFEIVSIKHNTSGNAGNSGRTLPDGTQMMTNSPIRAFIMGASPVPAEEVIGLPDWALTERYDVALKPPAGYSRDQRGEMMRNMFADRMKLVAHMEEPDREGFALVLARRDGKLGPQIKPSTLDCRSSARGGVAPAPPPSNASLDDFLNFCGSRVGLTGMALGYTTLDSFAAGLKGLAGGPVVNRTGLQGYYGIKLTYAPPNLSPEPRPASPDDPPDVFTALQEQLGLKLQREKMKVNVFVIDHIERPSEN